MQVKWLKQKPPVDGTLALAKATDASVAVERRSRLAAGSLAGLMLVANNVDLCWLRPDRKGHPTCHNAQMRCL
mgnify:CR=1 FL=1